MKDHMVKYLGWYIILAIAIIAALVYFFWWKPNHPTMQTPADGTPCSSTGGTKPSDMDGIISNGVCKKTVITSASIY